jgi:hypothetical protein
VTDITVDKEEHIRVPETPNFLLVDGKENRAIHTFSDEMLTAIGKAWTMNIIKKAERQRLASKGFLVPEACGI